MIDMFNWFRNLFNDRTVEFPKKEVIIPIDNQNTLYNLRKEGYNDVACYASVIKWLNDSNDIGHYRFQFVTHSDDDIECTAYLVYDVLCCWKDRANARGTIEEVYKSIVDQLFDYEEN